MRKCLIIIFLLSSLPLWSQADKKAVRKGNREFRKEHFAEADIEYRRALNADTSSVKAAYNLANALYREQSFDEAGKYIQQASRHIGSLSDEKKQVDMAHKVSFNAGDIALQKKDYKSAVEAFIQALVANPDDMDAKENYLYAKKMLENQQQGGGGGDQDQNQEQNQDQSQDQDQQNQDQNQDQDKQDQQQDQQNQDQNQNQNQNQDQQDQGKQGISPQQAQQMLQAIQAKEKETQDKVKKEKAAALSSRQKEKNW